MYCMTIGNCWNGTGLGWILVDCFVARMCGLECFCGAVISLGSSWYGRFCYIE